MLRIVFFLLFANLFFTSCEEDITLDIPGYDPKLSVFCILRPDSAPTLFLNRSKGYFNYADTSSELSYIADALVIIKDITSGMTDTLQVVTGDINLLVNGQFSQMYRPYYQGKIKPQINHRYTLNVWWKGQSLKAETTVPTPVQISSVTYESGNIDYSSGYTFYIKYQDQHGQANSYNTVITYASGRGISFNSGHVSYNYDYNVDGREMINTYFQERTSADSITYKLIIENNTTQTAEYIESVYSQLHTSADPFTEPVTVKNSVSGGLGLFGAITPSKPFSIKVK